MKRIFTAITRHPKLIVCIFALLAILSFFIKNLVFVDYDLKNYLPEGTPSTVAMDTMEGEYSGSIPNMRVMVNNVSIPQALDYKMRLEKVDGVSEVTWLDDSIDINQPLETFDTNTVETYYKNGSALFSIALDEEHILDGNAAIAEIIGDDNQMTGNAVTTAVATNATVREALLTTLFSILVVLVVLLLTTTSWVEPFIILIGIGIAVLINGATNLIFGKISFVTNAAGNVLQLAVSLDYSVFLIHRFSECRAEYPNAKDAMVAALQKSFSSIFSSGLTTVIGFVALAFMRFKIGPDLGLALAKGIAISLITVFIFVPGLVLLTYRLIEKTHHRSFMPSFNKFGKTVRKIMIPAVCIFVLLIVPSRLASTSNDYYYGAGHIFGENTKSGQDSAAIEGIFGKQETFVLLVPKGDFSKESHLSARLHKLPQVKDIISYVDTVGAEIPTSYLDDETLSKLISEHFSRMVITLDADCESPETFELVENIRNIANEYYPDTYYLAGESVSTYDLMDTITQDNMKVNLIAIGAVFLVLVLMMKSLFLPVILVLGIETAIWINVGIPYFNGSYIFYISYLIISSIQLGATVDYAILFADRYMENRKTMGRKETVTTTISNVSVSILTSAIVLATVGFLLGSFSTHGVISQLGTFVGRGSLLSLGVVLFILPGCLYLCDGLIRRTSSKANFLTEVKQKKEKLQKDVEKAKKDVAKAKRRAEKRAKALAENIAKDIRNDIANDIGKDIPKDLNRAQSNKDNFEDIKENISSESRDNSKNNDKE